MLEQYRKQVMERKAEGLVPKPLNEEQMISLAELFISPPEGEEQFMLSLLTDRVPPGVDPVAKIKAKLLEEIALGEKSTPLLDKITATKLLGTMLGGYNIDPLIRLLSQEETAKIAAESLSGTLLVFDAFDRIYKLSESNTYAKQIIHAWGGLYLLKETA